MAQSCLLNLKWRLHHVSLAARFLGSNIGRIAGRRGLMWRPRSLLWTVLGLIGYNPGILLAVRFDVWNRSRRCTSLMWLSCWRDVTRGQPERPLGVVRLSKPHQQWLYRVAMNTKMSSDNVLCQSCLEHTKSTKTLIFGETWHNTEINVIQTNVFFFSGSYSTKVKTGIL